VWLTPAAAAAAAVVASTFTARTGAATGLASVLAVGPSEVLREPAPAPAPAPVACLDLGGLSELSGIGVAAVAAEATSTTVDEGAAGWGEGKSDCGLGDRLCLGARLLAGSAPTAASASATATADGVATATATTSAGDSDGTTACSPATAPTTAPATALGATRDSRLGFLDAPVVAAGVAVAADMASGVAA
jgi:hypothetical protein